MPRPYLLSVKDNQPTLHADIESYFETAPRGDVEKVETIGKDHGRFEVRNHTVVRSTGMPQNTPIRARRALANSPPSPWLRAASSAATRSTPSGDPIFLPGRCRPRPSRKWHAAIAPSKTSCTGSSMSPSARTFTCTRRVRRQKHGGAPPRPLSGAPGQRQTVHQATPQARHPGTPNTLLEILGPLRS
jgi:hypothetical protein